MDFSHSFGDCGTTLHVHPTNADCVEASENTEGVKCLRIVSEKNATYVYLRDAQAVKLRDDLLRLFPLAEVNIIDGAHACCGEVCLCDESHADDETVLSGEILASDSDAAVKEHSL